MMSDLTGRKQFSKCQGSGVVDTFRVGGQHPGGLGHHYLPPDREKVPRSVLS